MFPLMRCPGNEKLRKQRLLTTCTRLFPRLGTGTSTSDAKVAVALKKVLNDTNFKTKVFLEQQKGLKKTNRFHRGRQIAYMIYEYFCVTGNHESILDFSDLMNETLRGNDVQGFDTRWDEVLPSITKIPQENIPESMYTMSLRESEQQKKTITLCTQDEVLDSLVKKHLGQKTRDRNVDAKNIQIGSVTLVK